jgi:hypothetical protein
MSPDVNSAVNYSFHRAKGADRTTCMRPNRAGILAPFLNPAGGSMDSTSQYTKWTPYEVKAASILYERRSEDIQLEQLRIRLEKKMQQAENLTLEPSAA